MKLKQAIWGSVRNSGIRPCVTRGWKRPTIDLAIGVEGKAVEKYIGRGDHVIGQTLGQEPPDCARGRGRGFFRYKVRHQYRFREVLGTREDFYCP